MEKLLIDGGIWFIAAFWQVYMLAIINNCIFNLKSSIKQNILISLFTSILCTILKLFLLEDIKFLLALFMLIIVAILYLLLYKIGVFKSLMCGICFSLISIPIELLSGIIGFKFLNLNSNIENVIDSIPLLLIMNSLFSLLAFFTYYFKNITKNFNYFFNSFSNIKSNYIFINIISIVVLVSPNIMFYALNKYDYPLGLLIFNILANIILVILGIYNTYKQSQLETKKIELQNSELHNKNLTSLIDTIRVFKHDYNNVVHAIGGYISLNDMEGLKKYYSGLVKDSQKVNRLESITPDKINEPSIYSIIASKYQMADLKNVTFNLESMFDYKKLEMPIYDFCKVLGVLLDNAIEAAEETDDKKVNVVIRESYRENVQSIVIENTYENNEIDTEKIFEKDYSTKNRNSGLGLWEVRSILAKNKNVNLYTSKDDKYFKQQLIINI